MLKPAVDFVEQTYAYIQGRDVIFKANKGDTVDTFPITDLGE